MFKLDMDAIRKTARTSLRTAKAANPANPANFQETILISLVAPLQ